MDQRSTSYWSRTASDLLEELGSSPAGLTEDEARRRLARDGPNTLHARRRATRLALLTRQFTSPIVLILLAATGLSAVLGDWIDAAIIAAIVAGSALLSFIQEYGASVAVERLRAQISVRATVVRGGRVQQIPAAEIVRGDVVHLFAGSLVPADGVVLEARDCFVDQAVLTGETFPVEKAPGPVPDRAALAERSNCLFMGTSVRSGTATAVVVQTGMRTTFGQIAGRLALRPPETGFQRGIRRLGYLLSEIMFVLVLLIFAVNVLARKPVLDSLLFSLALAVGLTPQLLPAIIQINLSRGAQAMARRGVIVRRLEAIENFGSMDTLCTDKTGTLTQGVVRLDAVFDADGGPSDDILQAAYLNAHFQSGLPNPLDAAITAIARDTAGVVKVDEIPYDFTRKRLSVVVEEDGRRRLIAKGALELLLEVCSSVRRDGADVPLAAADRRALLERYAAWSAQGYRVLGVAARPVEMRSVYSRDDETGLVFLGFLLFFDPPKPGVREVIADLASLGVELKVITGDNRLVARHTAEAVGLPVAGLLTGAELDEMHDEALWHQAVRTTVFAEVDPNQKERIIRALQRTGRVVGYMGDGINDAPALHTADVGISVDQAVDVAREAADFVLLERDLAVLHQGIVEGRSTFANTLKYVFMATSANFGNMFSMAGASLLLPFLPLLPKQVLLVNVLTDLPELTIATDNVDPEFVARPHHWDTRFIRRFMFVFGPLSSLFDFLTFGALLLVLGATPAQFRAGWFVESILSAALVVFVLRTRRPLLRSRPSRAMVAVTAAVIGVTLLLPRSPIAGLLGFQAPAPAYLLLIVTIVAAYLVSAEVAKHLFYRLRPSEESAGPGAQ
ncbi:MAG: magnesium-translocating P-type ATPase [Armatimonadota bacterium]|nr:magnesium-translocating P-type ATPase [Armatimonadota bacterium]